VLLFAGGGGATAKAAGASGAADTTSTVKHWRVLQENGNNDR
jgi:hypothetical protein